jgi:acyl carrier protein
MIDTRMIEVIRKITPLKDIELKEDMSLAKDLHIGSMATIKLINLLEKEFDMQMDENDLTDENFETIASVSKLVEKKIKGKN